MAVLWRTKQALRNCIAKGSLAHKTSLLTEASVLVGVEDPASKVVSVNGSDPTRDTYQRKVLFDGTTFFVVYWDLGDKKMYYVASTDGETWGSRVQIWEFTVAPYYGGNVDIGYPNRGALDLGGQPFDFSIVFSGSTGVLNWEAFTIAGQVLTNLSGTQLSGVWQGGSVVPPLSGTYDIWVFHRAAYLCIGPFATERATSTEVPYGGTTTGGAQILTYKTSSPYDLFILAKGGDNKLYYNTVSSSGVTLRGSFIEIATLGTGFSDFCACSEGQNVGDPERIHLVYIKSTGELCYQKFESDAWSGETELVESGASYPVIACGHSGRLYVFYVKAGKIMMRKFDGSSWLVEEQPFPGHNYHNPTYLSSNQNVQDGKICLVWTEGTAAPYAVWFCCLEEAPSLFEKVSTLTLSSEEYHVNALIAGDYLYAGINIAPGRIIKINLVTFEREATLTLDTGENYIQDFVVVGNYLYVALATTPGKVVKVDLTTFTKVSTLTLDSGENYPRSLAYDGTYLYAGLDVVPAKVVKISLATFTKVETLNLEESDAFGVYALAISGSYLYAGLYFTPARIVKIDLSTFTKVSTLTFDTGEDAITGLVAIGDFLYASLNTDPAKVVKVDLSTFTKVGTLTMPTGEDVAYSGLAAYETSYLYFGCYLSPSIIEKISVATFERVDSLTLDAGESYLKSIHIVGDYIYVGTSLVVPGKIVKVGVGE